MAATSGAVLNGLCSSFLCGGKGSQALLGAKVIPSHAGGARKFAVVAAAASKKSWIPAVKGGAELIHGRWAMTAVVGIFVGQAWSGIPWFEAGADPGAIAPFSFGSLLGTQLLLMGWVESKRWVDFFNPESQSVEWATPWSKTAENFANATGEQGYPGGKFFDPSGLAGTIQNGVYVPDYDKLERLKLAEIKHARIAMLAMLIFYFEAGQGNTPLGALGL
ncbi:Chlorophyll a-b binding protein CP24 [Hibiscus syriacus]|uniref:Chlorophyll a-b binding protein, chloroplastic n=1 Tax=Hibiscus syriacus TaxID=106335 RepID=A0A6A3BID5_HIBSY|nr:Chlorophyll a-b binding protein CP24 [Hibiscus syriacus]